MGSSYEHLMHGSGKFVTIAFWQKSWMRAKKNAKYINYFFKYSALPNICKSVQ